MTSSARCSSPPPPMPSPVLLPVSLPSPPVRRKHILPRPATPPAMSLYEGILPSPVRERLRTFSAGPLSTPPSGAQHTSLEARERARHHHVPSPNRRLHHHRGRSGSPPPTTRRRSASPPPPVPSIPVDVRAHYRVAVPVSAPVIKTQFFTAPSDSPTSSSTEMKTKTRIAHIVPTRREANGVSYWDFTLATHSPPRSLPELEADDGYDSSDDESRADTQAALVGACTTPPSRGCRILTAGLKTAGAVTIAQFLGMAEPRFPGH